MRRRLSLVFANPKVWSSIVDFFQDLTNENQRFWRKLFLEDYKSDIQFCAPELETQLKQLYTAVTRCCKRLIFAETGDSVAFDAFKKWAYVRREKDTRLIDSINLSNVEANVMTMEQWTKNGLKFAIAAESSANLGDSLKNLTRALKNFREADDKESMRKAEVHMKSIQLRDQLTLDDIEGNLQSYVDTILALLRCGLLLEASKLCHAVKDLMGHERFEYTQEQLTTRLLNLLPGLDY